MECFSLLFVFKAGGSQGHLRAQGLSKHRRSRSLEVITSGGDEGRRLTVGAVAHARRPHYSLSSSRFPHSSPCFQFLYMDTFGVPFGEPAPHVNLTPHLCRNRHCLGEPHHRPELS